MTTDTERAEFEAWARAALKLDIHGLERFPESHPERRGYINLTAVTGWLAWQAARASKAGEATADIPAHRGYVLFGAGAYLLTICQGDERGPELVIHLATEEEKLGRTVGDLGDVVPDKEIPLERTAVRLQFASERGLFALEQQLRMLREEHFSDRAAHPTTGDAK
ncbi:MAG: hypothetical protein WC023_06320 [Rhodocyclaceae bacterium]